jgi:hypothetical protein
LTAGKDWFGVLGSAAQNTAFERKHPFSLLQVQKQENTPQGLPRGGEDDRPIRTDLLDTTRNSTRIHENRRVTRAQSVSLITDYLLPSERDQDVGDRRRRVESLSAATCTCGRTFKNEKGVKIHRGKTAK